jgi:hypothetical protein
MKPSRATWRAGKSPEPAAYGITVLVDRLFEFTRSFIASVVGVPNNADVTADVVYA